MSEESFTSGQGLAKTSHGALVPAPTALEWMLNGGAAQVMAVVLTSMKGVTAYSSTHRIFTEQQRLAMFGRDRGWCTDPSAECVARSRPLAAARARLSRHYAPPARARRAGGSSRERSSRTNHRGWAKTMLNGRPHWIPLPPAWLDPDRTPRRNTWNDL